MKPNDFSDARVLVTGGEGFIGSALVWALNRRGCENIVVCDRPGADEKRRNLTPLRFTDYVDADALRQPVEHPLERERHLDDAEAPHGA